MTAEQEKKLWKFPCEFPIKIVGKSNPEFETFAYTTLHQHFPDLKEGTLQTRPSKDGNYLAITVIVNAKSKEQLDALYIDLSASKLVLFAL